MLDEIGELTLTTAWKKVRGLIKDDPRYAKFSSSDRVISIITVIFLFSWWLMILPLEMWKRIQWIYEG